MKLHRHLTEKLVEALEYIFVRGQHADKTIEFHLRHNKKWGSRDRKFFAESVYSIVRWYRWYWHISGLGDKNFAKMETIPGYALWSLLAAHLVTKNIDLPSWPEFEEHSAEKIRNRQNYKIDRAVRGSIPDWIDQLGVEEFGADWDNILQALNKQADVFLRVNTLRISRGDLIEVLESEQVDALPVEGFDQAIVLKERKNVFQTKAFQEGYFEVQDAGSQTIAPLLGPKPGSRVVDACAGAGGKSLHLASLMNNKGKIIAMDIHEWKLKELRTRASRNRVDIIETKLIDSSKVVKRMHETADYVLLDVPCSGLGVLRRNPDTKWKLTPADLERLQQTQAEILNDYSKICKKGGVLVYATCSILPRENQNQVQKFLAANTDFSLEKEVILRPDQNQFDGFYAARMLRK